METQEPERARQGKKGTPVLMVLVVALILCVVLFVGFGASGWFQSDDNLSNANGSAEVSAPTSSGGDAGGAIVTPSDSRPPDAAK